MHYNISHFSLLPNTSSHSHMLILFGIQQCPSLIRSVACLVHILIFDRRAEGAFHLGGVAAQWGAAILPAMTVTRMAKQPNTRSVNKQNMTENRSTGLSYHLSGHSECNCGLRSTTVLLSMSPQRRSHWKQTFRQAKMKLHKIKQS